MYIFLFLNFSQIFHLKNVLQCKKIPSRLVSSDPIDHNFNYILEKSFKTYVHTGRKIFEKQKIS